MPNEPEGSIFDDPELTPVDPTSFDNITFASVGDRFRGRITRMDRLDTKYGKVAKFWMLDSNNNVERTMLAGAQDLWAQIHKLRPVVGDIMDIELVRIDGRRYIFNVEVIGEEPF